MKVMGKENWRPKEKKHYKVIAFRLNEITIERLKKKENYRERVGICL
jgi:hypothetical protein